MNKLEKAKEIVKENFENARYGIFDSRNTVGDYISNLYNDGELQIDICYPYRYYEVFGLSCDEFEELEAYYNSLEVVCNSTQACGKADKYEK